MTCRYTHVRMMCGIRHEHLMTHEQAMRLAGTPCCWCGRPIYEAKARRNAEAKGLEQQRRAAAHAQERARIALRQAEAKHNAAMRLDQQRRAAAGALARYWHHLGFDETQLLARHDAAQALAGYWRERTLTAA